MKYPSATKYFKKLHKVVDDKTTITSGNTQRAVNSSSAGVYSPSGVDSINDDKTNVDDWHLNKISKDKFFRIWELDVSKNNKDLVQLFNYYEKTIIEKLESEQKDLNSYKFSLVVKIRLSFKQVEKEDLADYFFCRSVKKVVLYEKKISSLLSEAKEEIKEKLENFVKHKSGGVVEKIEKVYLNIAKYSTFKGSSYIDLPPYYKNKKAMINVKNNDNQCFKWAILSALLHDKINTNHEKTSSYKKYENNLDFSGISFPTPISEISKFEKRYEIAINVYGNNEDNNSIIVHRISRESKNIKRIHLFLLKNPDGNSHYMWIKNFGRLLHDQTKHDGKKYPCERCLRICSSQRVLDEHLEDCEGIEGKPKDQMPTEDNKFISFKNIQNQIKSPYVIYADFESINKPVDTVINNPEKSSTTITQIQEACSFGYIVVRCDGKTKYPRIYRGEHSVEWFLALLQEEVAEIKEELKKPIPIDMTDEELDEYEKATKCWICEESFKNYRKKVRDHCHITGKFRGAAHSNCNLQLRIDPEKIKIPVFFHNLKGYDSHLIMQAISKFKGDLKCIPNNMEKYISFSLDNLVFKDSQQFLLFSLDSLVKTMKKEDLKISKKYTPEEHQDLLFQKGIYPYNHIKSWESFEETELPSKECFYNDLDESHISDKDYEHAKNVWEKLDCKTLGDYHDIYLETDVILLADVFEKFRDTFLNTYGLDPAHYYTTPGYSWDALFKTSKEKVELFTDNDMYKFIEKGMRGGISMVSKRHCKVNHKYLSDFNPEKESNYILYLDANNLYGTAMSEYLPIGDFKWFNCEEKSVSEIENIILNIPDNNEKGYFLEVDLEYPKELHDLHNDYPLAPESLCVEKEWLSSYQQELLENDSKDGSAKNFISVPKLVPNLGDKKKYVLHHKILQLYLQLGLKLTKVHRMIEFTQKPWMKSYIEMNTELRKKGTSDFEKNLYKLMNNAVYGKTMENVRKRVDIRLVKGDEENRSRKLIASPMFKDFRIFDHNLTAVHMIREKLVLNKPIYVGMTVLDLSKHIMYDFYYNKVKKKYSNDCCELLYTDTDSLLLNIKTEDVYKDMSENIDWYDTSEFSKDHELHSLKNKKVLGKMKSETAEKPIVEYAGIRPKMYCINVANEYEIKKAKGIKKYIVKKDLNIEKYNECLFKKKTFKHQMNTLRSEGHNIYAQKINKTSLNPLDTKRYILEDGITTLAFGNYKIVNNI